MKAILMPLFMLVSVLFSEAAFGQVETELKSFKEERPTEWVSYFSNETISIDYKFVSCNPTSGLDNEGVIFRYTNETNSKVILNWHLHLYYDGTCRTCDFGEEYNYELTLSPNESVEGNCTSEGNYTMKVFSRFIDPAYSKGAHLTAYKFDNLLISTY